MEKRSSFNFMSRFKEIVGEREREREREREKKESLHLGCVFDSTRLDSVQWRATFDAKVIPVPSRDQESLCSPKKKKIQYN